MLTLLRISLIEKNLRRLTIKRSCLVEKYLIKCENKWKDKQKEQN